MLTELCQELKNWFDRSRVIGSFKIENGIIVSTDNDAVPLQEGQYFRIIGSVFNDGVHQYPATDLIDEEEFEGAIWMLAIPKDVINLANDIEDWQNKYGSVDSEAMSPFSSESFGGYSYSKNGGGSSDSSSNSGSWQGAFASRMNKWRKIR
jgi:hypothetical protein